MPATERVVSYHMTTERSGPNGLPTMIGFSSPVPQRREPELNTHRNMEIYRNTYQELLRGKLPIVYNGNMNMRVLLLAEISCGDLVVFFVNPEDHRTLKSGQLWRYDTYFWVNPFGGSFIIENRLDIDVSIENHNFAMMRYPQMTIVRYDTL